MILLATTLHQSNSQFPTSDISDKADDDTEQIHCYPLSRCALLDLSDNTLTCFIADHATLSAADGFGNNRQHQ
jgi:hypothetical protein